MKRDLTLFGRPAAERRIAAGDENQIAVQLAFVIDGPAAMDGRLKPVVGSQGIQCRRRRKELRRRGRDEELLAVPLQHHFARFQIDEQQAQWAVLKCG